LLNRIRDIGLGFSKIRHVSEGLGRSNRSPDREVLTTPLLPYRNSFVRIRSKKAKQNRYMGAF
jgi:hypothetical protein